MHPLQPQFVLAATCLLMAIINLPTTDATPSFSKLVLTTPHPEAAAGAASTPPAPAHVDRKSVFQPISDLFSHVLEGIKGIHAAQVPPTINSQPAGNSSSSTQSLAARGTNSAAFMARAYDKVFGTHQIEPRYQFEPGKHDILEGAERELAAGFTKFKFRLYSGGPGSKPNMSLVEKLTNASLPNQAVFDLQFNTFLFWLGEYRGLPYDEAYGLTSYLIHRYKGTGKTFMLGMWKEDYVIRDWTGVGGPANPHPNANTPILLYKVPQRMALWAALQSGVDAAKRDLAAQMINVQVYFYVEINLMKNITVNFTIIDDVIPYTKPVPDYISVSLSTLPEYILSSDPANVSKTLYPLLDHVTAKLPDKPGVPGPRVFIGEYEFPLRNRYGVTDGDYWTTPTQELQAQHALAVLAAGIGWGVRHALWWTFYDNTRVVTREGIDIETLGIYEDRGFALVSHENKDSVLYTAIKQYFQQANTWLEQQIVANAGSYPCRDSFRQWAIDTLLTLTNNIAGGEVMQRAAPPIRQRGCN